jgi:Mce-associated membrane protein
VCLALTVLAASLSAKNRDTEGRTAAVRRTAGAMGTAMLTYDYRHLDTYKSRVMRLATAKFAAEFKSTFKDFEELYKASQGSSQTREVKVYVGDVSGQDANALVEVDYRVSGLAGKNRPLIALFEMTLVHTTDGWRVADLGTIDTSAGSTGSGTTTETSAPG